MRDVAKSQEREANFRAFEGYLASLLPDRAGEFALLRKQSLIDVFSTALEALSEAHDRFPDGVFSIQRVTDRPLDLGFLSYASSDRDTV